MSAVKGNSTPLRPAAELRTDSARGLTEAAADLTTQLQSEHAAFKIRVKEEPASIHIEHNAGHNGSGSFEGPLAALFGLALVVPLRVKQGIFLSRKTPACIPLSRTFQHNRILSGIPPL